MRSIHRISCLDAEELGDLLHLPKHEVRALIANGKLDDFSHELSDCNPPVNYRTPLTYCLEAM